MLVLVRHILIFTAILLPATHVASDRINVVSDGVAEKAELYSLGSDEYMSVDELTGILKSDFEWDERLYLAKITVKGHSVVLIPDNPFVSVDGSLISVPVTPQFHGGKLMVSILMVPTIFSGAYGKRISWYPEVHMLSIGHGAANIKGIRFFSSPLETKVALDLARPLKYKASNPSQDRYEVFLEGGVLNSGEISKTEGLKRVMASTDEVVAPMDLPAWGKRNGVEVLTHKDFNDLDHFKDAVFDEVEAGITGADYAVAESGTLILVHDKDQARLISLAPILHIAIVLAERFVPVYERVTDEVFGSMEKIPSQVSFITGPSMTADIQATRFKGMHGPKRVIVILVG